MLHHQEKETVKLPVVNFNVKKAVADSAAELEYLQKQRRKANRKRKASYQAKIDAHFFG